MTLNLRTLAVFLASTCLVACPKGLPEHLRIDPPAAAQAPVTFASSDDLLTSLVQRDPLVRAPLLPPRESLTALDNVAPVLAFVDAVRSLERGDGETAQLMHQVERDHPGTIAVVLSRGYRLRVIENGLANTARLAETDGPERELAALLTGMRDAPPSATLPRSPMAWLSTPGERADALRRYGDRWVLTGWLSGPTIELDAVAASLQAPQYDGMRTTRTGALVLARAERQRGDPATGLASLERATTLALTRVAADRDAEQRAWAELRRTASAELNADDPEAAALANAIRGLLPAAGDDEAAGAALLAIAAERWRESCPEAPCLGVDRVDTFHTARRWGPTVDRLARTWQVVALKSALDDMDVGRETIRFPYALVGLVDALIGTGAAPLPTHILRRKSPDSSVWLELGRSVGVESTDWQSTRAALGDHLRAVCDLALATETDEERRQLLERILKRAVP